MSFTPLFDAGPIIAAHAFAAMAAFVLGLWQLIGAEGTVRHGIIDYVWTALMLGVAASSLWIHELRLVGPVSPIHLLSLLVLVNAALAVLAVRCRKVALHRASMRSLFFLGLVVTGGVTFLPGRVMHAVTFGGQ
ncbi:DUF2306 domain-containing protein [Pseudaestuariivita sp.]|uniref:DUF2306 domain-containing protein n=1 Tax=Pseudaestuariivita sp. TaxID=2211669 RepID=UPI004058EBFD